MKDSDQISAKRKMAMSGMQSSGKPSTPQTYKKGGSVKASTPQTYKKGGTVKTSKNGDE